MKHCEYEDSTDCIWDAENQGNGEGHSFVDIDGSVYYTDDPTVYDDVWVDGWESFPYQYVIAQVDGGDYMVITWVGETTYTCPEGKAPGWLNEHGEPTSCVDNNPTPLEPKDEMVIPEVEEIEVPEAIESVGVSPTPPEYVDAGVVELAETGTAEVVSGALLGIALVITGVVTMMKGRRVA